MDLIQLESKIQDLKNLNQLKESKNPNKIQEINFSKESKKLNSIKLETKIKVSNLDLNLQKDSNLSKVSKVLRYRRWREAMNKYIIDT